MDNVPIFYNFIDRIAPTRPYQGSTSYILYNNHHSYSLYNISHKKYLYLMYSTLDSLTLDHIIDILDNFNMYNYLNM